MSKLVVDFETKRSFQEVGGKSNLEALGISVAGAYDYGTEKYYAFEEHELDQLEDMIEQASLIIGFNSIEFDLPVLRPYLKKVSINSLEQLDIMKELQDILGYRIGLDKVAEGTLGLKKSGDGLQAIKDFKAGRIQAVKDYCLDDVKITKEIYDYGLKHGKLKFRGGWDVYEVGVNIK